MQEKGYLPHISHAPALSVENAKLLKTMLLEKVYMSQYVAERWAEGCGVDWCVLHEFLAANGHFAVSLCGAFMIPVVSVREFTEKHGLNFPRRALLPQNMVWHEESPIELKDKRFVVTRCTKPVKGDHRATLLELEKTFTASPSNWALVEWSVFHGGSYAVLISQRQMRIDCFERLLNLRYPDALYHITYIGSFGERC